MLVAALIILAAAAAEPPINVVGHAWAPFISPMGEPFRPRTATDDTLARWFNEADRNRDGRITADEMKADADRFFALLDTDRDGVIGPEELIQYEWEFAPDVQLSSRLKRQPGDTVSAKPAADGGQVSGDRSYRRGPGEPEASLGGLQGGARYGLLNMPEPVAAADANLDRAITRAEFEASALYRFQLLDRDKAGALTLAKLDAMWTTVLAALHQRKRGGDGADSRIGIPVPLQP
jgi:Ca2+-binding EF-hand superfamily protein